ncbi:MAG: peptidoglycan-associated lipoprotein Pal [Burkholderiales bacterium]|nr:peptidoglycan-associated lipoprotein Pal [Burkholderiales bacterium]
MRQYISLAALISSALLLAACGTNVPLTEKAPVQESKPTANNTPTNNVRDVAEVKAGTVDPLDDPKGELAKRSVYFDFDAYVVKDEYKGLVQAHANYLSSKKTRKIVIQGNTDERGGSEYNLALGQKRADAVRKAMSAMGVADSQMEAVSNGKEKPKALGSDEASWAENRRADIVY